MRASLTSITVTPVNSTIPKGLSTQLTATGTYSDGTSQDITPFVTWRSDAPAVATISGGGRAAALAVGKAVITAALVSISGTTNLTVSGDTLTAIAVTPSNPTVPNGLSKQLTATGTYSNGVSYDITSDVTWSSATQTVASVDDYGMVSTAAVGSSVITATLELMSGATTLTVSSAMLQTMSITPPNPRIPKGLTQRFTVMGTYSDGTSHDITSAVYLSTGDTSVAYAIYYYYYPYDYGLVYGAGEGSTAITATLGPVSVYTTLTVDPATLQTVTIYPANPTAYLGVPKELTAIAIYSDGTSHDVSSEATWSSSDTSVATVDGDGLVSPIVTAGSTTITATWENLSGSTLVTVVPAELQSITVLPSYPTIPLGLTKQLTATGMYSDGSSRDITSLVAWSSLYTWSATVNSAGLVSTVGYGSSYITATLGSVSGSTWVYVGSVELQRIDVTPTAPSVPRGLTKRFTATGTYSDNSTQDLTQVVIWSSGDTMVATIDNRGIASTLEVGSAVITATSGTVSGNTTLTVGPVALYAIQVVPAHPMMAGGATLQFTAAGLYSDGTTQDLSGSVTWGSDTPTVAGISSSGLATSVGSGLGASVITATSGTISGTTTLTRSSAASTPSAVSFQIDSGHSGHMSWDLSLSFPSSTAWQVDLGGASTFPIIANGRVFALSQATGNQLVALDVTNGQIVWGPIAISGTYSGWGGMAYDNGKLFVLNSSGLLQSFNAVTGQPGWSTVLAGQNHFPAPPVAANGRVFAKGAGSLYAIDQEDGAVLWTSGSWNGTNTLPALSGTRVFLTPPCEAESLDQATGTTMWRYNSGCSGGGGTVPVVGPNDRLLALESYGGNRIVNSLTGQSLGTFPGTLPPAVGSTNLYTRIEATLQSVAISSQQINWNFTGDGTLNTLPIVVNDTVFIGARSGNVYAVNASTGTQLWSAASGGEIAGGTGYYSYSGLAAANGYLVVPAGTGLTAWKIVP